MCNMNNFEITAAILLTPAIIAFVILYPVYLWLLVKDFYNGLREKNWSKAALNGILLTGMAALIVFTIGNILELQALGLN